MPAKTINLGAAPAFALPVLFLGYAAVANVEFASGAGRDIADAPRTVSAYLTGEAAAQLDGYYKKVMPHRTPSIDLMGLARYAIFREGRSGVVVGNDGWLFSREEFAAPIERTPDLAEAAAGLAEVHATLADKGIALVVVPLPAKADIYRGHLSDAAVPDSLARLYADFVALLEREGIAHVDTREPLLAARAEGQLFLTTDTHWTPLGARVTAQALSREIGVSPSDAYTIAAAPAVPREGDLSKFIVTGELAPLVGLGPESVTPYRATTSTDAAATDIFGPSSIPYILTGTSYSANDLWSFGDSLKAALGADVLNMAEEGKGPIAPMRALLTSETLRDNPPETVIWEFPIRYLGQPALWTTVEASP
jgi:alginate O-acetyltransferase complex protein AlgJ